MPNNECTPPIGTKDGTRHVLRRGDGGLLMDWHNNEWRVWFPEIPGFVTFQAAGLARDGWRYAGRCPPLPELPQDAWEIAEEELQRWCGEGGGSLNSESAEHALSVLERIAAMKPGGAP